MPTPNRLLPCGVKMREDVALSHVSNPSVTHISLVGLLIPNDLRFGDKQ